MEDGRSINLNPVEGDKEALRLIFRGKSENVKFGDYLKLILAIDRLYKAIGGDALQVTAVDSLEEVTEPESLFEQHKGTQWANKKKKLVPIPLTSYTSREEVYAAVDKYAQPQVTQQIKQQLDQRYSKDFWGDNFPTIGAFQILVNENLENLINK